MKVNARQLIEYTIKSGLIGCGIGAAVGVVRSIYPKKKPRNPDNEKTPTKPSENVFSKEIEEQVTDIHPETAREYKEAMTILQSLPLKSSEEPIHKALGRLKRNMGRLARLNANSFRHNQVEASDACLASSYNGVIETDFKHLIPDRVGVEHETKVKMLKNIVKQWKDNVSMSVSYNLSRIN